MPGELEKCSRDGPEGLGRRTYRVRTTIQEAPKRYPALRRVEAGWGESTGGQGSRRLSVLMR